MGCGQTLHLSANTSMIMCLDPACPDQGAAQKILSDPQSEDVVIFGADSFTVRHPLKERLGDLVACPVHSACSMLPGAPGSGAYRASVTSEGVLRLEKLDEDTPRLNT